MGKGIAPEKDESTPKPKKKDEPKDEILLSYPGDERVCVGAPLIDNKLFYEFEDDFPEDAFTVPMWRGLFRLQRHLYNLGYQVDKNTVLNCAGKLPEVGEMLTEAGGIDVLESACAMVDIYNFSKHLEVIRGAHGKRMILEAKRLEIRQLEEMAVKDNVTPVHMIEVIDRSIVDVSAKIRGVDDYEAVSFDSEVFLREATKDFEEGRSFVGVKTNMKHFDDMMGGLANGRLYIMGGPTGGAKSLFQTSMCVTSAYGMRPNDPKSRHLIIDTGELLYKDDFLPRLIANMSGVFINKIADKSWTQNPLDRERVMAALRKLENDKRIFWKRMTDFDGPSVRSLIKRMKHKEGIEAVWFDNIKPNPRWQGKETHALLGDLAQYLKDSAIDFELPVFALIQLTADGTSVGKKKGGFEHANVDMFAGGRRILQNADCGMVMEALDPEDPFNDNRAIRVGKSRSSRWHRKGEFFEVTGNLACASLTITKNNLIRPLDHHPEGVEGVSQVVKQGASGVTAEYMNGRTVTMPKKDLDYTQIPDFDVDDE